MSFPISQGLDPPLDYQENDDVRVSSFPSLKARRKRRPPDLLKLPKHEKFVKVFFIYLFLKVFPGR
jgi:hypothetical protein